MGNLSLVFQKFEGQVANLEGIPPYLTLDTTLSQGIRRHGMGLICVEYSLSFNA